MPLIVETGAGIPGANSFVDAAYADAYFAARAISAWTGDASAKEAALVRGGQYLNGLRWQGSQVDFRHIMCWPRYGVPVADCNGPAYPGATFSAASIYGLYWNNNEIPEQVRFAQCEAALRYLTGTDMLPDLDRGGQIVMKRVEGAVTTQYANGAPAGKVFQAVNRLLQPFLKSSASVELVRA